MTMEPKNIYSGACHCKAVQFEIYLPEGLTNLKRCNCSFCRMRSAIMGFVKKDDFKILKGAEKLSLYQFNSKIAKHYFCSVCGIYTHHQRRSDPSQFGFNVACIEGVDPYELGDVAISNGAAHSVVSDA